jgi:DNA invertase Pin-like site-specific DNA recombinase
MLIGYARVSTDDQHLDSQRAALRVFGCQRIYEEKISGAKRERPELSKVLDHVREGDVLVATRLDRLARSTRDLLEIAEVLNRSGVGLRSLAEPWADTTSPSGKMILTVFAGIAEFERSLIVERTSAGRFTAKQKGVRFGRPPKLSAEQVALGQRLLAEGTSVRNAARILNCHHATLYRAIGISPPQSLSGEYPVSETRR